jgi:hypothetical protein
MISNVFRAGEFYTGVNFFLKEDQHLPMIHVVFKGKSRKKMEFMPENGQIFSLDLMMEF